MMKKLSIVTFIFAIMLALCATSCDNDKDEGATPADEAVCDPDCAVCTCETVDGKKECKCDKLVEECFCDDAKTVACPEGGKDACETDAKPEAKCETECGEGTECKCEADKCECVPVNTEEPPATEDPKCDPACTDTQECKCEADKCACEDKAPATEPPTEEPPAETKTCDFRRRSCISSSER